MNFIQLSAAITALTAVLLTCPARGQFTYTTLDVPGATETIAVGIDGNNIVGRYTDSSGSFHGFFFDGTTFLTLDDPSAVTGPGLGTTACGIRGNTIVGAYHPSPSWGAQYGFEYNLTTTNWQTLIPPGMAWGTSAFGVSDNNIVGYYADPYNYRGYRFDGSSYSVFEPPWTILDYQTGGLGAWANGIDGNKVVGVWRDSSRIFHGYLFDGTNFSKLDDFGTNGTLPYGISGSNIVGYYTDSSGSNHGFLFNGTSYTTLDHPLGTNGTYARGISGNNIVGFYTDSAGQNHGFKLTTTTTPPASLSIGLYAGLTITGTVGKTYSIQSTTNLADINSWTTIANITLTQPVQLWVDTSINVGPSVRHFYRLASVP